MKSAKNQSEAVVSVAEAKEVQEVIEAVEVKEVAALRNDTMTIWRFRLRPNRSSSLKMKLISKSG